MKAYKKAETVMKTLAIILLIASSTIARAGHAENHLPHKHHASVFLGNTHAENGQDGFTIGADYEYRFHKYWGAAALVDYATPNIDAIIIAGGVFLHSVGDLRLLIAPGIDHHHGHTVGVFRLGAIYDFHVGGWSISPTIHIDMLDRK